MKNFIFKSAFALVMAISLSGCSSDDSKTKTCDPGYTGNNCDVQITPKKMLITKFRVISFPMTDTNGNLWDTEFGNASNPDIYIQFIKGADSNATSLFESDVINNATSGTAFYDFTPPSPIVVTDPLGTYIVALGDSDTIGDDEVVGAYSFIPYTSNTNGFPATFILSSNTSTFAVQLTVEYQW